jgi:hypothetical protein
VATLEVEVMEALEADGEAARLVEEVRDTGSSSSSINHSQNGNLGSRGGYQQSYGPPTSVLGKMDSALPVKRHC